MSGTLLLPGVTWASIGGHTELAATKGNLGKPPYFKVGQRACMTLLGSSGLRAGQHTLTTLDYVTRNTLHLAFGRNTLIKMKSDN